MEVFDQGRYFGLREHVTVRGETKELYFYPEARIDGLVKRVETPLKVTQTFTDRDDFLTYRSVKYQSEERSESFSDSNIEKMTEKFDLNPGIYIQYNCCLMFYSSFKSFRESC